MRIIPEALSLAKLQRTSMTESQIIGSYEEDFNDILKHGPERVADILDIGCGIAGWECFLEEKWKGNAIGIYLIDKTQLDEDIYYGFKPKTSFYSSLDIARKNLIANGISSDHIFTQEATEKNEILFETQFDLIVSFISCGFHYPVETYLDKIYDKLKSGGTLIIDIRKGSGGTESIYRKFLNFEIIKEKTKYWRVKATK